MIVTYQLFESFASLFKSGNVSRNIFNDMCMGESTSRDSLRAMYDKIYGDRYDYEPLVNHDLIERILNSDEFASLKEFFSEIQDTNRDTFKKFKDFITDTMHGKLIDPDRLLDMKLACWNEDKGNDFCYTYIDDAEIIVNTLKAHKWKEISVTEDKYPAKIVDLFDSIESLRAFHSPYKGYAFLGYRENHLFLNIVYKL